MAERLTILQRSSGQLIRDTESESEQRAYSEEIKSDIIGSMRLSSSVSVEDSEDYAREVVVNSAKKAGIQLKSSDVEKILNTNIQDLNVNLSQVAQYSADAFSIGGLEAMSSGDLTKDSFGLLTTTSNMLEDGKISGDEAVQLSVSAAKTAGSVIAMYSSTVATGPLAAVIAIPFAAINFLQAEIDEQAALDRAAHEYAKKVISEERRLITEKLSNARAEYIRYKDSVWRDADRVVSDLAELWYRCEEDLGVRFGIRFFPGEAPPPKGGLWRYPRVNGDPCVRAETPVGGQLYFPTPNKGIPTTGNTAKDSAAMTAAWSEFDKALKSKNLYRTPCSTDPFKAGTVKEPKYGFEGYTFYAKTVRALNALLPIDELQGFWVPEDDTVRTSVIEIRDYEQLVYQLYYDLARKSNQTPPLSIRDALSKHEMFIAEHAKNPDFPAPPSIDAYAARYVGSLFDGLIEEGEHVNTFKLRVFADIMQTASAVRAEIAVAKHFREAGLLFGGATAMTQSDKRGTVLERPKEFDLGKATLWAGIAAAGFGGWKYWRHRGRAR